MSILHHHPETPPGDVIALPLAVALHREEDEAPLGDALQRDGFEALLVTEPTAAFAAVVRGASVLVVDASAPGAADLLRGTRRRIDDGWSNCAVVGYFPPETTVDHDLTPLLDAVARYPVAASSLEFAIRVAATQRDDRATANHSVSAT